MSGAQRLAAVFPALALVLSLPSPTFAQAPPAPAARPPADRPAPRDGAPPDKDKAAPSPARRTGTPAFRVAGFVTFGYQAFAATDTFDATLGTTGGRVLGGGGSLTHRSGLFAQVDVTQFSADGERAFAYNGEVFRLGIPLRVEVRPVEVTVGYKFFTNPRPPRPRAPPAAAPTGPVAGDESVGGPLLAQATPAKPAPAATGRPAERAQPPGVRLRPYVGGGFGWVAYKESADFAASGDNVDDRFTSVHVLGGVEVPVWRWVGAVAEFQWRRVAGALGEAGLSKEFGEDDLGGVAFRVKVTVGR